MLSVSNEPHCGHSEDPGMQITTKPTLHAQGLEAAPRLPKPMLLTGRRHGCGGQAADVEQG